MNPCRLHWECGALTTGPPGKFLSEASAAAAPTLRPRSVSQGLLRGNKPPQIQRLTIPSYFSPDSTVRVWKELSGEVFLGSHGSSCGRHSPDAELAHTPDPGAPRSLGRWALPCSGSPRAGFPSEPAELWPSEDLDTASATSPWSSQWLRPVRTPGRQDVRPHFSREEKQGFACVLTRPRSLQPGVSSTALCFPAPSRMPAAQASLCF